MQASKYAQNSNLEPLQVVIIDDSEFYRSSLKSIVNGFLPRGSNVQAAETGDLACKMLSARNDIKQCLLLDLHLEQESGLDVLLRVKEEFPELTVIMITSDDGMETAITCLQEGAEDYVVKGAFSPETLERTIHYAVGRVQGRLETKRLKKELQAEKRMNTMHRSFINLVNHEFRTPLAIIYSAAQWMRQSGECDEPVMKKRLDKIDRAVKRLENLMNNVAMLDRLEEGHVQCLPRETKLHELVTNICNDFEDVSPGSRISLDLAELPRTVMLDQELFSHVVQNIVSNALKYSDEHSSIDIWGYGQEGGISLFVRDHGVGIPSPDFEYVGQKFFRSDVTNHIPGTGLGLFLSQQFLECLGGTMYLCSELDEGTTIKLYVPVTN